METTLDWRRSFPAMETALDASGAGFGVFWGSQETGDDSCASKPQTAGRTARSVTSARRLPPIPGHSSSRLVVASVSTPILSPPGVRAALSPSDRTPTTLLDVLHTLLTNIRRNSSRFMKDTFGAASRVGGAGSGSSTLSRGSSQQHCYIPPPPGVEVEDREFFEQEQALTADREAFFAATTLARKRHCALDDLQTYHFDRSASVSKKSLRRRRSGRARSGEEEMQREAVVIERQHRKIEHLLHVLQTEIANETRRSIKLVEIQPPPRRPLSRQKQRTLATLMKDRYEAADRVMRILEEYKIVVGADAAKYLQETIAAGKVLLSSSGH